jgi:uncharacterized LabA/DUF88 family protein
MKILKSCSTLVRSLQLTVAITLLNVSEWLRTHIIQPRPRRVAILIDGDSAATLTISKLLPKHIQPGMVSVKRVYCDLSLQASARWRQLMLRYSIIPVHACRNTRGKNATDMRMAVDAMDLLYSRAYDEFWIVSTDSDFTTVAWRIRLEGLFVRGFGESKAPQTFVDACNEFTFTDRDDRKVAPAKPDKKPPINDVLRTAVLKLGGSNDGWAPLTGLGAYLRAIIPDFRPGQYGFATLSGLIGSVQFLEVRWEGDAAFARVRDQQLLKAASDDAVQPDT